MLRWSGTHDRSLFLMKVVVARRQKVICTSADIAETAMCNSICLHLSCPVCTYLYPLLWHAQMDGLSTLEALEELWLCRNRFTEIGNGLPLGPAMREINLAHNRLGCFKELLKLAPLEGLRSLTLQDPHFGDNSVCGLSNYKTFVAYHLTQVQTTDTQNRTTADMDERLRRGIYGSAASDLSALSAPF